MDEQEGECISHCDQGTSPEWNSGQNFKSYGRAQYLLNVTSDNGDFCENPQDDRDRLAVDLPADHCHVLSSYNAQLS
jgi:hypothetical protein